MLRASAKNFKHVAAICDPADYEAIVEELLANDCQLSEATHRRLAYKVYSHTRDYDTAIAAYFEENDSEVIQSLKVQQYVINSRFDNLPCL